MDDFDGTQNDVTALLHGMVQVLFARSSDDRDILTLARVATLLHCSEDTLRRVPCDELPIYRVGKTNLYFRDDVLRFVRTKRVSRDGWRGETHTLDLEECDVDRVTQRVLGSPKVDARKLSKRRVS